MADSAGVTFDARRFEAFARLLPRFMAGEQDKVLRAVGAEALRRVIMRTPVAEEFGGTARAGWKMNVKRRGVVTEVVIQNNVHYIVYLEFGTNRGPSKKLTASGHSTQAPQGMVRITIREMHDARLLSKAVIRGVGDAARRAGAR